MTGSVVAIDLGATSGRVIVGRVGERELTYEVVHRFPNGPVSHPDGLHWDVSGLFREIIKGLQSVGALGQHITSIGVDSWAVDYGLLADENLLWEPFHYRDDRTARGIDAVHRQKPFSELFTVNGLQFLTFNTIYQLAAEDWSGRAGQASSLLLVPDLVNYWLAGTAAMEVTNASTTGLLDVRTGLLSPELIALTGANPALFQDLIEPGQVIGEITTLYQESFGFTSRVVSVASHDTASAVIATPLSGPSSVYISCGTWGLVGLESDRPILSDEARAANFTNERGLDGRIRFLKNVMGLWLINECVATWREGGLKTSVEDLVEEASHYEKPLGIFDVNDPIFMPPGQMPARIVAWLERHDQPIPESPVAMVASIVESLAIALARAAHTAGDLAGVSVGEISIVGGGSLNALLCQRLADHAEVPVVAGPVEATALGNLVVQASATGLMSQNPDAIRDIVRHTSHLTSYTPRGSRRRSGL